MSGADAPFCARARAALSSIRSYQCVYRAVTYHEGKIEESVMRYSWEKPGKVRMDIEKPKKGAVLLYNPEISDKVRVRPFPSLGRFVLNYELTHKRVSSDGGGTVDRSDLGHRVEAMCELIMKAGSAARFEGSSAAVPDQDDGKPVQRRFTLDDDGFLRNIEILDREGKTLESFEWKDLKADPQLPAGFFEKF